MLRGGLNRRETTKPQLASQQHLDSQNSA